MTNTTVIISLLAVLVGYIVQAVNTGSIFGVATVPQKFLPYLSLVGSFLAAFVASVSSSPVANEGAFVVAAIAGLQALTGAAVGVTAHQHITAKPIAGAVVLAIMFLAGSSACAAFGADVQAATPVIGPVLQCIVQAVDAGATPSATTIEDTVMACGVAATDVEQVVSSIEALASAPTSAALLKPGVSVKLRAMPHRPLTGAFYTRPMHAGAPVVECGWL